MFDIQKYHEAENRVWDASCATEDNESLFSVIDQLVDQPELPGIAMFRDRYRQLSHRESKSVELSYDTAVHAVLEKVLEDAGEVHPDKIEGFRSAFAYVCAMIAFREDPDHVSDDGIVAHLLDRECPNGRTFDYKMRIDHTP